MKKRMLFIAALPTKKFNFDGERNKSRDVLAAFRKFYDFKISVINLSKNKLFQLFKTLCSLLFKKPDCIFVSKCIVGGSLAIHLANKIRKKNNCYFYIIGNGYYGFDDKKIYFDDIVSCKKIIVESEIVKQSMIAKGILESNISIFPCLKPSYDLPVLEKHYEKNQPLKLLYFSRINPDKGLGDLIEVLIKINSVFEKPIFSLDVTGGVSKEPGIKEFEKYVIEQCDKYDYLNYLGMSLRINGIESYKIIQNYDLHVFPTRFKQECAPGSIIDMFVAGVPTLSSKYPSFAQLLNEDNSYLFDQGDLNSLEKTLMHVYDNAYLELNKKRVLSHKEYEKYTDKAFIDLTKQIGIM